MKICRVCKVEKDDESFYLKKGRNCRNTRCKECDRDYSYKHKMANIEHYRATAQTYGKKNRERITKNGREHRQNNPEKYAQWEQEYLERTKERRAIYREKNKSKIAVNKKEYMKGYRIKHKERDRETHRLWAMKNKDLIAVKMRTRLRENVQARLRSNFRSRAKAAIKGNYKRGLAIQSLGCTIPEFIAYIEPKFKEGMTWDNWTRFGWHLDHIKPLCLFDMTDEAQVGQALHYTNLQPLWWNENLSKHKKYDGDK